MKLDYALRYLGNFGPYQTLVYILLSIFGVLFASLQKMGFVFVSYTPKPFHCTPPSGFFVNETVPCDIKNGGEVVLDSCHMYDIQNGIISENLTECKNGWEFETIRGETSFVTDVSICVKSIPVWNLRSVRFLKL